MATLLASSPVSVLKRSTPDTFPRTPNKFSSHINLAASTSETHSTPINMTKSKKESSLRIKQENPSAENWSFEQRIQESLQVLKLMESQGMEPNPSLFCLLLKSCADMEDLEMGRIVHDQILETGLENHVFVSNNLINMYARCGCFDVARQVFDEMAVRNMVSWTSVISMYNQVGCADEALRLYDRMKLEKIKPNAFTYTAALNACAKIGDLQMGFEIHDEIVRDGCDSDPFVVSALIDMYAKCSSTENARKVFDKMSEPSAVAYTAMIEGYNLNNESRNAIELIRNIFQSGVNTNIVKELDFSCMIRSCSREMALRHGQEIHAFIIKSVYKSGAQIIHSLVLMYAKCGKMTVACILFDTLLVKDTDLWVKMILGCVKYGFNREALNYYFSMLSEISEPDSSVISCVLDACACLSSLLEGKAIHARAVKAGHGLSGVGLVTSLVNMYRNCGELEEARKLILCQ